MSNAFSSQPQNSEYGYGDDAAMQNRLLNEDAKLSMLLDSVPDQVILLNPSRQAVFANRAALDFTSLDLKQIVGLLPGEIYNCANCADGKEKCGQTRACHLCGMTEAFRTSRRNARGVYDCTIATPSLKSRQLRIWAVPQLLENTLFSMMVIRDVHELADKEMLERLLLTQVRALVNTLQTSLENARRNPLKIDQILEEVRKTSAELAEIVSEQDELRAAETNTLNLNLSSTCSLKELQSAVNQMNDKCIRGNKKIVIASDSDRTAINTDPRLLRRVLDHMMENALDATSPEEHVVVGCHTKGGNVEFSIYNNSYIPEDVQLRLFQRHFSTRDNRLGMGAYSARLLAEKYLNGKMDCLSSPSHGTTFVLSLPMANRHAEAKFE